VHIVNELKKKFKQHVIESIHFGYLDFGQLWGLFIGGPLETVVDFGNFQYVQNSWHVTIAIVPRSWQHLFCLSFHKTKKETKNDEQSIP